MDQELKIEKSKAIAAYNKGTKELKEFLCELFGAKTFIRNYTDLKTIRDCVEVCGKDFDVEFSAERTKWETPDETAYREWKFICQALNEGEVMDFSNNSQRKYYGWMSWVSGRGLALYVVSCGNVGSVVGPRLSLKDEARVKYAHSQFPDTFNRFYN